MPVPLRQRLIYLVAAGLLPLAVMAGISLYALRQRQNRQTEQTGLELARSVANSVDSALRSSIAALETLATTPTLEDDDMIGFRTRAQRVLYGRPEWVGIQLLDNEGRALVDTRRVTTADFPPLADRASFDRVLRTRAPTVGNLSRHPGGEWLFAVRVPVVSEGIVKYVLSALTSPNAIRDVLTRQQDLSPDYLVSIIDAAGLRVARSFAHEETLGGRLTESVQRVVAQGGAEGFGMAHSLEGDRIFTPYRRIDISGWYAVLGIPTAQIDAAALQSLAVYGLGVLLSVILGTLGAIWVGRTITRPMETLRIAADALARNQVPQPPQTPIEEIRDVGAALRSAGEELVSAETEREALLVKERQSRENAEAADRAKDEFMTVLSHELRTPLNAVYGWARMLQSGQLTDPDTIKRAKDAIVRNADAQVQLIDDLLDLSRITSGKMRLDVRRVDIPQVLHGALDAVKPAAAAKEIDIAFSIDPDLEPVTGDPARLQQVIWNLLSNAVKFTPRGGRINISAVLLDHNVQIQVADTGRGMSPDILPYVFERFRQADSSSTRAVGGLGLGLSLVKHLVELHGGTVVAESAGQNLGATFTVTLPVSVVRVPAGLMPSGHVAASHVEVPANIARLDHTRVLVVDDDPEGLALAEAILARAGAEVRACSSAEAAMTVMRDWRPDVLVSDVEMPEEDGYSLIQRVRALGKEAGGGLPAVALTGYGRPQDRLRALASGFNMHVPKPVDPGELTTLIAGLAERTAQRT